MNRKRKSYTRVFVLLLMSLISCSQQNVVNFYVSPDGSDYAVGTEVAPFHSLEKAKMSVRVKLAEKPGKTIVVNIKGGLYHLEKPVILSSEDSGTENTKVIYKAAEGEEPVFTGSRELKGWELLNDSKKLKALSPKVRGKIYVTNVKANGITDLGDPSEIGKRPELFCNGKMQTLSRWPNKGFVKAGLAIGKTDLPPSYIKRHGTVEGIFEYLGNRPTLWINEKDARLGGYWSWDWSDEFQKIKKIDARSKIIYIKEPFHHYGYRDSLRYFGMNLFCEIDQPGEWYLDRTDSLLYWFPPKDISPNKAKVTISCFSAPFMMEIKDCSNVTIENLTFREGRGSAIFVGGGKNCLISDCRIQRFGEDGIHIEGGEGNGISGCFLKTLGCKGIEMKGGDRKTLTPALHFVENTVVKDFSLFKRTYMPAVWAEGCGIRISHNLFMNSSSSALRLQGNDITLEYNEIRHVVSESDDQGGVDMYYNPSFRGIDIRYNRWSDITGGTRTGAAGVRLDDMISGISIYGNVFERCGAMKFGAVQINGGKDNFIENNLFYKCHAAASFTHWSDERWLESLKRPEIQKKLYKDVNINSSLYQSRYPELKKDLRKEINVNTVKNNLLIDCDKFLIGGDNKQHTKNNYLLEAKNRTIDDFFSAEIFKKYEMQPIPVDKIGLKNNKWINKSD